MIYVKLSFKKCGTNNETTWYELIKSIAFGCNLSPEGVVRYTPTFLLTS